MENTHEVTSVASWRISSAQQFADALTVWEQKFIASLRRQRTPISQKQQTVLDAILVKARRAEAMA